MKEGYVNAPQLINEAYKIRKEVEESRETGVFEEANKRLFTTFSDIDYNKKEHELSDNDNSLGYTMGELTEKDWDAIQSLKTHVEGRWRDDSMDQNEKWHALDKLIYKVDNNRFNILEMLPPGYRVLFHPDSPNFNGAVVEDGKRILIEGDIASPGVLATILHEIGHVYDTDKLKRLNKFELTEGGDIYQNSAAETLRKEREASLFALRKMWPMLRKNPQLKSDTIMFLKNYAYFSFCHNTTNTLENSYYMNHYYEDNSFDFTDDDFDERLEKFEKSKQTAEYKEWRDRHPDINEDSVMGYWEEWQEFISWKNSVEYADWKKIPDNLIITDDEQEFLKIKKDKDALEDKYFQQEIKDQEEYEEWTKSSEYSEWSSIPENKKLIEDWKGFDYWFNNVRLKQDV